MSNPDTNKLYQDALEYHSSGRRGKIGTSLQKPLTNPSEMSLAYSPGVAAPCLEIEKNPLTAYDYTAKGNLVAVISNGTAVLGLGNLGALASKPVMEGKAALFKKFADIDAVDIEVSTQDPEEFINSIKFLGASWGGINLEDIKAPECFIIESRLKELLDIPVFHDDQHGTAIITAAGMINAADITGRSIDNMKVVVNGAGAAAIACIDLLKSMGLKPENTILCDTQGVIYKGRTQGMNPWKEKHATDTKHRTLAEALVGADAFLGLSAKGAVTQDMVKGMAPDPIIFAMANPDPEIMPHEVKAVRSDAIIATGRSDFPNQVNNVMGFPYIFRGALDVEASTINEEMKIAAAQAIAMLAREHVPNEVASIYAKKNLSYGPEYIIPVPFDPRLIQVVPMAVAKAAIKSGVARKEINFDEYYKSLSSHFNPAFSMMHALFARLRVQPKRVIFADGDEEAVIRTAIAWRDRGYGTPILLGYEDKIKEKLKKLRCMDLNGIEITNAALHADTNLYIDQLYAKLQRKGYLRRDCAKLVKRDRNIFATLMLENNFADAIITGFSRPYLAVVDDISKVMPMNKNDVRFGLSVIISNERTLFIADTTINECPTAQELAHIAIQSAKEARLLGHEPRVAFLSFSNFGSPMCADSEHVREAVALLDAQKVDFEYDGEMAANVALNADLMKTYPFCRLSKPANILIMPSLHSANISAKLLQEVGNCTVLGPISCGFGKSIQIMQMGAAEGAILNLASIAANRS